MMSFAEDRPFTPPPPRERLSYTRYQLELLNGIYDEVRYPNSTQKQLIAKRVGITREQVKVCVNIYYNPFTTNQWTHLAINLKISIVSMRQFLIKIHVYNSADDSRIWLTGSARLPDSKRTAAFYETSDNNLLTNY